MALIASWEGAPADRGSRARAFATARRHTRLVRMLRVLLPVAGVATVLTFVAKTHFSLPGDIDLAAASLSVTRNSIIMDRPHLTGFDGDAREYSLSADRAIQPLTNPGQVRLESIEAKVTAAGHGTTTISAEAGDYDHAKNTLELLGVIAVASAEGYQLDLTGASIDFAAGTLVSDRPVSVGYGDSRITGSRLSVSDGGKMIVLEGNVRTLLMPPKREPDTAPETAPGAAAGAE